MKSSQLLRLYAAILLVVFGGIVLHAPLSVGFGTLFPDMDLLIKSWKEILLAVTSGVALVVVWRRHAWRTLLRDRIIQVALVYGALHLLIAATLRSGLLATMAGIAIDLRFVAFFVLIYICIEAAPEYKKRFVQVFFAGAVIVVGFGVMQLFLPADILSYIGYGEDTIQPYLTVDKNPDYIRINSTLRGPNPLGAYMVIVLGLLAAAVVRRPDVRRTRRVLGVGIAAVCSLVVLWVSYSRSAVAAAGITVLLPFMVAGRSLISRRVWIIGSIVAAALIGGSILGREHSFVENVVLHENDNGGSLISSNDDHVTSLMDGTERTLRQPFGAGIGSTGSASLLSDSSLIIENQYLFIAHEVGWLGLGLFLVLLGLIFQRLWRYRRDWLSLGVLASGIGLSLIGILLPVWADDTVSIIWWGLAALAIATGGQHVRTKVNQKTA